MPDKPIVNEIQVKKGGDIIIHLEEMIKNYIDTIAKLKNEKKKHQEMFADGFANNPVYRENDKRAKEAIKVRLTTKQQIASTPSMVAISHKVKDLGKDIKERQFALSDYLLEYQRLTSATQLELFDGEVVDIVNSAKVVKHSSRK